MKTLLRGFIVVCACGLLAIPAAAQITITKADVAAQLAVGSTLTNHADSLTKSINIGSKGSTSWDFSALNSSSTTTLTSVAPASTPFAAQFPTATHALQTTLTLQGITGTGYQFLRLDTDLVNPGLMASGEPLPGVTAQLRTSYTPPDTTYALPSTLGTTWHSTYTDSTMITLGGISLSSTTKSHSASYVVDAFGPMTLPGGTVHQALRIRKVDHSPSASVSYIFLSPDGASVQVSAQDTTVADSGMIQARTVSWSGPTTTPTSVAQTGTTIPKEFALQQNYPNPFNPTTSIRYSLPERVHVVLEVFNTLGQRVATLVNEDQEAGIREVRFNGANLPSGMYFYRLQAGSYVDTKKLALVK